MPERFDAFTGHTAPAIALVGWKIQGVGWPGCVTSRVRGKWSFIAASNPGLLEKGRAALPRDELFREECLAACQPMRGG